MSKPLLRIGLPVVLLCAAIAGYMVYRGKQDAPSPAPATATRPEAGPLPVYTYTAEPRLLRERVTATGTILAEEAIDLTAEIAGKVVEMAFEEGGRVAKGDVLVKINDSELQAELAVFWLSQVPSERALGYLEDILKTTNDDKVADKAIFAISQHNSARASQMLRDYASNQNADFKLRDRAIFWLG